MSCHTSIGKGKPYRCFQPAACGPWLGWRFGVYLAGSLTLCRKRRYLTNLVECRLQLLNVQIAPSLCSIFLLVHAMIWIVHEYSLTRRDLCYLIGLDCLWLLYQLLSRTMSSPIDDSSTTATSFLAIMQAPRSRQSVRLRRRIAPSNFPLAHDAQVFSNPILQPIKVSFKLEPT
jgi:hypothetical protein